MRELRVAARLLWRSPGFASGAIATFALGIGAATTVFSVVYGVLLRPLPFRDPARLVVVEAWQDFSGHQVRANYSLSDFPRWDEATHAFEACAFVYLDTQSVETNAGSQLVGVNIVTPRFFDVLAGRFVIGRSFSSIDGDSPVVVISSRLWHSMFSRSDDVLHRQIVLNSQPYSIVGVTAESFDEYETHADAYVTSSFAARLKGPRFSESGGFNPVGRLKPGVAINQAQADVNDAMRILVSSSRRADRRIRATVLSMQDHLVGGVRPALTILLAAVGLVLVIACANVANMLLARNVSRSRELAIRRALGASRWQLARQSLAESVVIAAAGSVAGTAIAFLLCRTLVGYQPEGIPRLDAIHVDLPVLAVATLAAAGAALILGALPALQKFSLRDPLTVSSTTGHSARRLRSSLVAGELALSIVLLVGAALLGRSFLRLLHTTVGARTDHVAAVLVDLSFNRVIDDASRRDIVQRIVARVASLPGIVHAAAGTSVPPNRSRARFTIRRDGSQDNDYAVDAIAATPRFFSALGIPLVRGRFFTDRDDMAHPRVAIMTASTARDLLGNVDPIGRTISLPSTEGPVNVTIVGIVGDIKYSGLETPPGDAVYEPFAQQPWSSLFVVARTSADPASALPGLRRAIGDVDPMVAIASEGTIDEFIASATARPRFRAVVLIALAVLAAALAGVGLYSVAAYAASRRTMEIGIRMALGANRHEIIRLVVWDGARVGLAGIGVGIGAALAFARGTSALLYGIAPLDAVSFCVPPVCLVGVTLIASYLPARWAARVDPVDALRAE
jgi:putative ABC transport system permease protein